ncbi:hypothetical protein ARMGADRAFT_1014608 [Armillaria gallica]|uniref:Uncharacterized protein n=1 Tax=Armillaria gallica TaxID=47427 RepID=A0A2H3D9N6_ARMGA|nr:hypothetical protein ARMGADRAFT_1014608 [Armillaria gallica]
MRQDPHHKPEDWESFLRSKRDKGIQHHRTSHNELTNTIYNYTASANPSGLTTTVLNPPYLPLQPHHHEHSLWWVPRTAHSKRNKETQHRHASHDEPTNTVYNNTASVSPPWLTTTMPPSHSRPSYPRHHWQGIHSASSPTLQPPFLRYLSMFAPPS